ncbi:MAG: hypothetical protein ABSG65_02910, partial [Bryobacteraceae bacterium]
MFTWICPTCGREVPPSYDACPDCAAREKAGAQPAATAAPLAPAAPDAPAGPAPPAAYAPPAVAPFQAAQYAAPPPQGGLPTWLMAILFAFAFMGVGAGVYFSVQYFRGGTQAASTPVETAAAKTQLKQNPLQKYVEVSGIRFVENPHH